MENCNVCKFKSVNTFDNGFLCKIHGPMYHTSICKEFVKDETKIKVRKCNECAFFKPNKSVENDIDIMPKGIFFGTCLKYLLREYDGQTRNSCSQFMERTLNNIT